tara:strand:+ start:8940 stop:10088 length:1149 start_codon:yes stop_codon:yes gene_type:complete
MALLSETNEQYYAGQQAFIAAAADTIFVWTGNTTLVATTATSNTNFKVKVNNVVWTEVSVAPVGNQYQVTNTNEITTPAMAGGEVVVIELLDSAKWDNYGSYSYIKMNDVIDNFLVGYVGEGKLITNVKRSDVLFHAKRGLQEFSYDTLKSIKSQELTIPESLSLIIPQDYVNYVNFSWIDDYGVQHPIYPVNNLTDNPYTVPLQDAKGIPTQDNLGKNTEGTSITNERWNTANDKLITGDYDWDYYNAGVYDWTWDKVAYGQRYGLDPQTSQKNGWFNINEREGKFSFSSNLKSRLIILEYISDGLSVDYDMRIPKLAEEAIYMHIIYSILASRINIPEYIVQRYKKERRSALRNAKIRLSNIKLQEIIQVMRDKSKWIKH